MENLRGVAVKIKKLSEEARIPAAQSDGAAGVDIAACISAPIEIAQFEIAAVPSGLALEIPRGYEAQVRPRSGLALKQGITVLNAPGTIDSDYRGELNVILINFKKEKAVIHNGDRIAQLVFSPVLNVEFIETSELHESKRGEKGFGSTGL